MLGQQEETQERLTHQQRQQPVPEQKAIAPRQREQGQGAIDGELPANRLAHLGNHLRVEVGHGREIGPNQLTAVAAELAGPPVPAADLEHVAPEAGGGRILKLRVEPWQVGVAVVPLVVAAVKVAL